MSTNWVKSSYSAANGQCVEARIEGPQVHIRDSKNQTGPVLSFETQVWTEFLAALTQDGFDAATG